MGDDDFGGGAVLVAEAVLVVGLGKCEHAEGGEDRNDLLLAGGADHGCRRVLRDASLEEPAGRRLAEAPELHRALEVGRDGDDGPAARTAHIALGEIGHRVAVGRAAIVALGVGQGLAEIEVDVAIDHDVVVHAVAMRGAVGAQLRKVALGAELGEGARGHLIGERLAVIVVVVLDEGDALAHDRLQEEQRRSIGVGSLVAHGRAEGGIERGVVVTIHHNDIPAVGHPRCVNVLRHDVGDLSANLEPVQVNEGDQVVELVLGGEATRLADLPLLLLAVAHADKGGEGGAARAGRHRKAGADREPLTQVAGVPLHARDDRLDVATEDAAGLAEAAVGLLDGEVTERRQRGVDAGRDVAVAHDHAVAVGVVGCGGVERTCRVEDEQRIKRREATTRVARSGKRHEADDVGRTAAAQVGKMGKLLR